MTRGVSLRKIEKGTIRRKRDWRARLQIFIASMAGKPFSWQDGNDCAKFAANAVEAMTGVDPMKGMRAYRSEEGAKKTLTKHKLASHVELVERYFEEIKPQHVMPGDIVVLKGNDGLGIFQGQYVYTPGIALVDPAQIKRAFRVPEEDEA